LLLRSGVNYRQTFQYDGENVAQKNMDFPLTRWEDWGNMRIPKLSVILGTGTVSFGSLLTILDFVGRWDAAMHVKSMLPAVLASPFCSPVILAIGLLVLHRSTKGPLVVAPVFDAHGNEYKRPRYPVLKYGIYAVAIGVICSLILEVSWHYLNPKMNLVPPRLVPVDRSSPIGASAKVSKKNLSMRHKGETPCTPKLGKFYSDYSALPGGPKLERPMLVLNMGTYPFVMAEINGTNLLAFELVISNRGEASIAKNWELCLVHEGKPVLFAPARIPSDGIVISANDRITPEKSLIDHAIQIPVEHAKTAGGWAVFKADDASVLAGLRSGKETVSGSIRFKDYLDHLSSFEFEGATGKAPDIYVPGAAR
jgi:hypothetical protein